MMYRSLILFLVLGLSTFYARAQFEDIERIQVEEIVTKKINTLRERLGVAALKKDSDLINSAQLQANYISEKEKLSHSQDGAQFKTVRNRVDHFNKNFEIVGENVLYTRPLRAALNERNIKRLAFEIYNGWKNSPGHYQNMISSDYIYEGLALTYNKKTKRIYAAQVFGKKGYVVENQLSPDAFGIIEGGSECDGALARNMNSVTNMGNNITLENNEVVFKHHNARQFRDLISGEMDGLAIDLVSREQLTCGDDNKTDVSPIYDGVLLKPVYRDAIFSNNEAKGDYRLIVKLGTIPEHLRGKSLSANIILIKDNKKCGYSVPTSIPSSRYPLRSIEPVLVQPKIALSTSGILEVEEIEFNFDTNKTTPNNKPTIDLRNEELKSVTIKSYTSIDGSSENNRVLHTKRAQYIEAYIKKNVDSNTLEFNTQAKENWELFDYQLEKRGLEDLRDEDHGTLKKFIVKNKNVYWNKALQEQRKSKAILYKKGSWAVTDPQHQNYNFLNGLLTENNDLINKSLYLMYQDESTVFNFLAKDYIMDLLLGNEEVVQNISAVLIKNSYIFSQDDLVFYIRNWLTKPEKLSAGAQENLLNLYTITSNGFLRNWDTSEEDLSKILHPNKVEPLFKSYKSSEVVNPLFLNFHISSIYYYGQINYSSKIGESFTFITDYFRKKALTIEDDIDLSLFFNSWSMYHLTIELMDKSARSKKLTEEADFLRAQTMIAYPHESTEEELIRVISKALKSNKERWCFWIDSQFQSLRSQSTKNLYCKNCSD